ncbi:PLD-like domain-containing protein [Methanophagales archaeon]|nr:PLD-like domain-containing protein [Methanophagales archaeon]
MDGLYKNKHKVKFCHFYEHYHPKVIFIDDKVVVIRSYNYRYTAFSTNREISMRIVSGYVARYVRNRTIVSRQICGYNGKKVISTY